MNRKVKYANDEKGLLVTLWPCGEDYEFVVLGDDSLVSDKELMSMVAGDAPKGWSKQ